MNESIYLCYKRTMTSTVAASLVFEKLRNNGYAVYYTRKLRKNDFIKHIEEVVYPIDDAIILLDDRSFMTLDEGSNKFLESWFGRELITCSKQNKHIILICLNGYKLPERSELPKEIHFLYDSPLREINTFNIDVSESIDSFIGELKSRPVLKSLIENKVSYENSADFLIYSDCDCNIYECGYLVATIDCNVDKHHPFKYTVNRSGQHYFYIINNDTGQTQEIAFDITPGFQKYIHIEWEPAKALASLTEKDINTEKDNSILYNWGKSFFYGNPKLMPDYNKALLCFQKAAVQGDRKAVEFILKYDHSLASIYKVPEGIAKSWYKQAAEWGSAEAWMKMGEQKEERIDYSGALTCYQHAEELGHVSAHSAIERCKQYLSAPQETPENIFLSDFHNIVQNFSRLIGSVRIGKYKKEIDFKRIAIKLVKVEELLRDSSNAKIFSTFINDSKQTKYCNRMFAFLGYLAQKDVFRNLSHKDILEICMDESGENQMEIKDFRQRMGGDDIKESNISKMADRVIADRKELDKLMNKNLINY